MNQKIKTTDPKMNMPGPKKERQHEPKERKISLLKNKGDLTQNLDDQ